MMSLRKCELWEVYTINVAIPSYLKWFEEAITFDRNDHSD
jgi:hypothetical protein